MKALSKLLADFVAWRWAPTVGLLSASVLFVLMVVGLVPSEIGVPVANTKFSPKPRTTATAGEGTTPASLNATEEASHRAEAPTPVAAAVEPRPAEFGRRGFSPVLDRPEPPPAAPAPPPPPAPVVPPQPPPQAAAETPAPPPTTPPTRASGIFQTVQNALRAPFNGSLAPRLGGAAGGPNAPGAPGQADGNAPPGAVAAPATSEAAAPDQQQPAPGGSAVPGQ